MSVNGFPCEEPPADRLILERNTGLQISTFEFAGMNMVESQSSFINSYVI